MAGRIYVLMLLQPAVMARGCVTASAALLLCALQALPDSVILCAICVNTYIWRLKT
jgi:hypothetical protein